MDKRLLLVGLSYYFGVGRPYIVVDKGIIIAKLKPVGGGDLGRQYFPEDPFTVVGTSRVIYFIRP